jgi:hypothetical protein
MNETSAEVAQPYVRSRAEKFFLGGLIVGALSAGIIFLALTAWSIFMPPMGIALLFGIVVATLAYAFLGAKGDDKFGFRAIQVAGAAAVVLAVVWVSNEALERQFKLSERVEELNRHLLIDTTMHPTGIVGGGSVKLVGINTLNGWKESKDHQEDVRRPDARFIFKHLFATLDIDETVEAALKMSDDEWQTFLSELADGKRLQIGGIAFATVRVRSSDGLEKTVTMFKEDQVPVTNRSGVTEACLTAVRVLDVRERRSGEAEVLVLNQDRGPCR